MADTILVPLDGSAESNAALPLARTLAKATSASLTLLRVLSEDDREGVRSATENLQKIASELAASTTSVDSVVRQGRVADEILSEIRSRPAALVVMRTHGRVGFERAILGSVTDQVLAGSPVPLVLMRPGQRRITGVQTVLVPVDGSPGGAVSLGAGVALARATGASINLVQVTVPLVLQTGAALDYSGMGYYDPAWDDEFIASAKSYVAGLVGRLRGAGLTADGEVLTAANAAEGIVNTAEQRVADVVVMSTRALTGPARTLLGSVANAVVRTANCPVMLVHRTEDAEAEPTAESGPTA